MKRATVFNVQRFSLQDGPGIRTTVFLKGCPLHCVWCHNPESMDKREEVVIKADRCLGCERCAPACPQDLAGRLDQAPDRNRPDATCLRCGACADACPADARELVGQSTGVAELMEEILRDRPYYDASGGGITFSGGEPLVHANLPFLRECLLACGRESLHRTIDTCGHVRTETLLEITNQTELLLFDLKLMDEGAHRKAVGTSNQLILHNLRAVVASGHRVWVRVPLVPGWNDDEANLRATAEFVAGLSRPCPVHLLPYHSAGSEKYGRLGREYALTGLAGPDPEAIARGEALFRKHDLEVHVGG